MRWPASQIIDGISKTIQGPWKIPKGLELSDESTKRWFIWNAPLGNSHPNGALERYKPAISIIDAEGWDASFSSPESSEKPRMIDGTEEVGRDRC